MALLGDALGVAADPAWKPVHPADAPRTRADVTRARRVLGWAPQVTLQEGIAAFARWYEVVHGQHALTTA